MLAKFWTATNAGTNLVRILLGRQRKRTRKAIEYIKYRLSITPRMPTYDRDDDTKVFYPKFPYGQAGTADQFTQELFEEIKANLTWEQYEQFLQWVTRPPMYTTVRVNQQAASIQDVISSLEKSHQEHCRKKNCEQPRFYQHEALPDLVVVEPSSAPIHISPHGKEIIVDLSCGQSILRGANVFCGGVLGAPIDLRPDDQVAVFADADGRCLKGWSRPYGGRKIFVGNGIAAVSRRDLFCQEPKKGIAVTMSEPLYPVPTLFGKFDETIFLQNLPSLVAVHVLNPQPDEFILDLCAAPGGKATHIASLMRNRGKLVALDRAKYRLLKLKENVERMGLDGIVQTHSFNSVKALDESIPKDRELPPELLLRPPFRAETFDRVLVDAPCSGLGNRPQLCRPYQMKQVRSYADQQKRLLEQAVKLVKVGGTIVYSTCSVSICENEVVVEHILNTYPGSIVLDRQQPYLGQKGWKGSEHNLSDDQLSLLQRFVAFDDGSVNGDTIGFFIAKFTKVAAVP